MNDLGLLKYKIYKYVAQTVKCNCKIAQKQFYMWNSNAPTPPPFLVALSEAALAEHRRHRPHSPLVRLWSTMRVRMKVLGCAFRCSENEGLELKNVGEVRGDNGEAVMEYPLGKHKLP